MSARYRIIHVSSEMTPLAKVGGLGDVVGALSVEQARRGHDVIVALPGYRSLAIPRGWTRRRLEKREVPWGLNQEPAGFELLEPPRGPEGGPRDGAGADGVSPGSLRVLVVEHLGERRYRARQLSTWLRSMFIPLTVAQVSAIVPLPT